MTKRESQLLAQNYIQERFAVCTSKTTNFVAQLYLLTRHYPDSMLFFFVVQFRMCANENFSLQIVVHPKLLHLHPIAPAASTLGDHVGYTFSYSLFNVCNNTKTNFVARANNAAAPRTATTKPEPIDEEPVSGYKTLGEASNKQTFQPLKIWRAFKYQSAHSSHRFSASDKIHRHSHNLSKNIDRKQHRYKRFIERNIQICISFLRKKQGK